MSKLYRLKSDHAVKCEAVFLPTSRAKGGLDSMRFIFLDEEWILPVTEFDRHWEPDLPPAPPVLAEDELGRLAGQLDGWLTIGPFDGKALAAFLRRAAADLRRLRWEKTFVGGVIPTKARYRGQRIWIETLGDGNADLDMQRQFEILAEMGLILSVDK